MQDFFEPTFSLLGQEGRNILSHSLIAIAGLGGVGGGVFLNLVRCGVRRFRVAENGIFDPPDMNHQEAAFSSTMGRPKIEVYEQLARELNPEIELELFPKGVVSGNFMRFLDGSDIYVGAISTGKGVDIKTMTPALLRRFNIPLFTAGVFGFGAFLVAHHPKGMMPDEFWGLLRKRSTSENPFPSFISDRFEYPIMERITNAAKTGKITSTSIGGTLSGAVLASEILAYLLRRTNFVSRDIIFAPKFAVIDPLRAIMEIIDVTVESNSETDWHNN